MDLLANDGGTLNDRLLTNDLGIGGQDLKRKVTKEDEERDFDLCKCETIPTITRQF